ncbi:alanine dehydrogenase [Sandaracinus amylolyticus]|uniref:Alanine dehydrogenase n=1 Tax=Sandaracinus amylolyticus TaxID=927083 RepID=A0A0F6W3E9_9BACT|nr:alanine dehydrogenase [Sandaracinus amylolyticus]AKF06493.1 Alanine dehydrogenase [Sandaracinus amylolyticus]
MIIGVPTEIKTREYRVGINPGGVRQLTRAGHEVRIQKGAGIGAGIADKDFEAAGARIVPTAADAWSAEMVMKVKEPLPEEYGYFRPGLILYTYLHLAPLPELTKELMAKKVRAIAYETVQNADGSLPLLRPMSEVAGRMATQVGASCLEKERGGKGLLLGGVPGTRRGHVVVLGGGVVGAHSAKIAVGMGAQVTVLDVDGTRMSYLEDIFGASIETLYSNPTNIEETVAGADLVIGAVLVAGAKAPKLVDEDLIKKMKPGSVVVDVAVDQGGCIATCRPTTHDHPTFELHGVIHYCVPNMPGAVSMTSTFALTNVTITYAERIAREGVVKAIKSSPALALGVNVWDGACVYQAVAEGVGVEYTPLDRVL